MILRSLTLLLLLLLSTRVYSQDPEFSQYYFNPVYLNPAFAGSCDNTRLILTNRIQWPSISAQYKTASISYDSYMDMFKGGGSLMLVQDIQATNLRTTQFSGGYAYHARLNRKLSLSLGLQSRFVHMNYNYNNLLFGDMIDPELGFIYETQEVLPDVNNVMYVDFNSGIILHSDKFHTGFAMHHMNEASNSLLYTNERVPKKFTYHGTMFFKKRSINGRSEVVYSPSVIFIKQGEEEQVNFGLFVRDRSIFGGLWYRGTILSDYNDAFIIGLGAQKNEFKITYTYDLTVSDLTPSTGGAHEINIAISLKRHTKKPTVKPIECPYSSFEVYK